MNHKEFIALHAKLASVIETYFAEAHKTSMMLGRCAQEPLPFMQRFALLTQEIKENNARLIYLDAKRLLHSAALVGYARLPDDSSVAARPALNE